MSLIPLSTALVTEVLYERNIEFETNEQGHVRFFITRKKGKDLNIYISNDDCRNGILTFHCYVWRYFSGDEYPSILVHCNQWNRDHRLPKAYVENPDKDGDYLISLDHTIFCHSGIERSLISENLSLFSYGSIQFWDEIDEIL